MNDWRPSQRAPATACRSRPDTAAAQSTAPAAPLPPASQQANGHLPADGEAGRQQRPAADLMPAVTVPRGGGAIRGLDEKLAVDAATGTCAMSVRIPFSPGRSGFTPAFSLAYDSGCGKRAVRLRLEYRTARNQAKNGQRAAALLPRRRVRRLHPHGRRRPGPGAERRRHPHDAQPGRLRRQLPDRSVPAAGRRPVRPHRALDRHGLRGHPLAHHLPGQCHDPVRG